MSRFSQAQSEWKLRPTVFTLSSDGTFTPGIFLERNGRGELVFNVGKVTVTRAEGYYPSRNGEILPKGCLYRMENGRIFTHRVWISGGPKKKVMRRSFADSTTCSVVVEYGKTIPGEMQQFGWNPIRGLEPGRMLIKGGSTEMFRIDDGQGLRIILHSGIGVDLRNTGGILTAERIDPQEIGVTMAKIRHRVFKKANKRDISSMQRRSKTDRRADGDTDGDA